MPGERAGRNRRSPGGGDSIRSLPRCISSRWTYRPGNPRPSRTSVTIARLTTSRLARSRTCGAYRDMNRSPLRVLQDPALAAGALGDQDRRLEERGRVELDELHVLQRGPGAIRGGDAVPGGACGRWWSDRRRAPHGPVARTTLFAADLLERPLPAVERDDPLATSVADDDGGEVPLLVDRRTTRSPGARRVPGEGRVPSGPRRRSSGGRPAPPNGRRAREPSGARLKMVPKCSISMTVGPASRQKNSIASWSPR